MKITILLVLLASAAGLAHGQSGGTFDLKWSTIDTGGGTSRGGPFAMSGTAGQSDAGALTGGNFKLEGGFWNGPTVMQTPGAPLLKIRPFVPGLALISWPVSVTGFTLEERPAAGTGVWTPTPQSVVDTPTEHTVKVPEFSAMKVYRLRHP